jgi:pimeloyl-ACP methyl ester carboxylesterase
VHTLLYVGGLQDGLLTVPYTTPLAQSLPPSWRLVEVLLSSSYKGWGTETLDHDVKGISQCISYLQSLRPNGRVVIIGHSTGCQDAMHYVTSPLQKGEESRPTVHGIILQAGVSDREALEHLMAPDLLKSSTALAQTYVSSGRGEDCLPSEVTKGFFPAPVSANRWLSLTSPNHDGEDDYFSSDLSDEQLHATFGKVGKADLPFLILYGNEDEYVPPTVNKSQLLERWRHIVKRNGGKLAEGSGIIPLANHSLTDVPLEVVEDVISRIVHFVNKI